MHLPFCSLLAFGLVAFAAPHPEPESSSPELQNRAATNISATGPAPDDGFTVNQIDIVFDEPSKKYVLLMKWTDNLAYYYRKESSTGKEVNSPGVYQSGIEVECVIPLQDVKGQAGSWSTVLGVGSGGSRTVSYQQPAVRAVPGPSLGKYLCSERPEWYIQFPEGQNTTQGFDLSFYHAVAANGNPILQRVAILHLRGGIKDWIRVPENNPARTVSTQQHVITYNSYLRAPGDVSITKQAVQFYTPSSQNIPHDEYRTNKTTQATT